MISVNQGIETSVPEKVEKGMFLIEGGGGALNGGGRNIEIFKGGADTMDNTMMKINNADLW